ncbi:MAG TPA: ABC transporter permease [Anaerolineales bacterium]|nr:ABC transporter permease [Anaerolineales bacterium]
MPPILRFVLRRSLFIPLSFFVITATLFGILMLAPPEARAELYLPPRLPPNFTEEDFQRLIQIIIRDHGLDDPMPVQYVRWLSGLLQGEWAYSPALDGEILPGLLARVPATSELAIYTSLFFIPLGLVSGVLAARSRGRLIDSAFRLSAFIGTSIPPFILGLWLLSLFYVALRWFPPERLSQASGLFVSSSGEFTSFTGLLTIDGLLNGSPDISLDALRHLALPVLTLSLSHWATLGRLTRSSVLEEMERAYVLAARARGVSRSGVVWRHAFRNALVPSLNSTALSAASLVTGIYVVEVVFNFNGIAELVIRSVSASPDIGLATGFAVFSVLLVLPIMLALDVIQAVVDPRIREGVAS